MSSIAARAEIVLAITATLSLVGKEGYAYKLDGSNQAVIVSAVTDVPAGIIGAVDDDGLGISGIPFNTNIGTVGVKLGAAVTDLTKGLVVRADGTFGPDTGSGARVVCAMPMETGTSGEIIEAVLIPPRAVPANAGLATLVFPIQLASLTTAAADLLTDYVPGYAFEIVSVDFVTTTLGTGASASQVLNLEIGAVNLTGGVLTLALADTTPLGKVKAATPVTGANIGTATDAFSVEVAAGGTVFTAGAGNLLVKIRNLETFRALDGATA